MSVSAVETAKPRQPARKIPADRLVPFPEAAKRLGKTAETLRQWHDDGHVPAVIGPGGQWSTYESFIVAVLASARPGQAGDVVQIGREWFSAHCPEAVA